MLELPPTPGRVSGEGTSAFSSSTVTSPDPPSGQQRTSYVSLRYEFQVEFPDYGRASENERKRERDELNEKHAAESANGRRSVYQSLECSSQSPLVFPLQIYFISLSVPNIENFKVYPPPRPFSVGTTLLCSLYRITQFSNNQKYISS